MRYLNRIDTCILVLSPLFVDSFSPLAVDSTGKRQKVTPDAAFRSATVIDEDVVVTADENSKAVQTKEKQLSSRALESMLKTNGNGVTISSFFKSTWQKTPALFRHNGATTKQQEGPDGVWNEEQMQSYPYEELVKQGWCVLTDLLEQPAVSLPSNNNNADQYQEPALVILNGHAQHPQEWMPSYGTTSLFAPYVNGSSVNQPHADWKSPWLAAFCEDLQKTFPYVYANTYLTPPQSRALNLHADDREVFVVQLVGSKEWEVMKEVPVPFPYPHEQVGKDGLEVPSNVIDGGPSLTCTLNAGDVLYIPRGHCHQARCTDDLSFHVTIAVATFDWSLAGMMHQASQSILTKVEDYRKGILPIEVLDDTEPNKALQQQIDSAIELLKENITPEAILNNLQAKIEVHRQRAIQHRHRQFERARSVDNTKSSLSVGSLAAKYMSMSTKVRIATSQEQEQLKELLRRPPGTLQVRTELRADVSSILSQFQSDQKLELKVSEIKSLVASGASAVWCDLSWLAFAKLAVEAGVLAVADPL